MVVLVEFVTLIGSVPYSRVGPYCFLECSAIASVNTYPPISILIPVTIHDVSVIDLIVKSVVLNLGTVVGASSPVGM